MTPRRNGEEGMALLVVMVLMGIMLTTGFAVASTVDTQTSASQKQRVRDSAFNLAEAALNAQIFALARDWPGAGRVAAQYGVCTPATGGSRCPDNATLLQGGSPDLSGATWQTSVRNNGDSPSENFYAETPNPPQPGYDAPSTAFPKGDGKVWVRAQAKVQGRTRTLVALVRGETQAEDIPHAALIANSLDITNNGNKVLISAGNGRVAVKCDPFAQGAPNYLEVCLGHELKGSSKTPEKLAANLASQISGSAASWNYVGGTVGGTAMTAEARARLRATAIADGTWYPSCPTEAQLTGKVVYIENGNCTYGSNAQFNSAAAPGLLIINAGAISFGGGSQYYGVVYNANTTNLNTAAVQTTGNAQIFGGVLIDNNGQMVLGSSGLNLVYDVNAFRSVASYGSAGVIQNTWREVKGN